MVGAEPSMVNAVCEGIRAHGLGIANSKTIQLCLPLVPMLRDKVNVMVTKNALDYMQSIPTCFDESNESPRDDIDYEQLRDLVKQKIGINQRAESPAKSLLRYSHRMLVIPYE